MPSWPVLALMRAPSDSLRARRFKATRRALAERHIRGAGLEVGALHQPLPVPPGARVRYVDRLGVDDLRAHYPELRAVPLVPVDVIDDGETLTTIPDASQDFLIANHFLEHTEDPIGTLASHLRVLRPGGVLYAAIPLRDHTFDRDRELTLLEHHVRDHQEGPAWSRRQHFLEWAEHVDKAADPAAHAAALDEQDYSIHFHVWDEDGFARLLAYARDEEGLPFEVVETRRNQIELISVLRRSA